MLAPALTQLHLGGALKLCPREVGKLAKLTGESDEFRPVGLSALFQPGDALEELVEPLLHFTAQPLDEKQSLGQLFAFESSALEQLPRLLWKSCDALELIDSLNESA